MLPSSPYSNTPRLVHLKVRIYGDDGKGKRKFSKFGILIKITKKVPCSSSPLQLEDICGADERNHPDVDKSCRDAQQRVVTQNVENEKEREKEKGRSTVYRVISLSFQYVRVFFFPSDRARKGVQTSEKKNLNCFANKLAKLINAHLSFYTRT